MGAPAVVKVRLDTSGARSDLQSLYGDFRRAPGIPVGGTGGTGAPGGSGLSTGGLDLSRLLQILTAGFGAQQMVGATAGFAATASRDTLREMLLGSHFGAARGALASREAVAQQFGFAFQQGIVSKSLLETMFDVDQMVGEGARTQGIARARQALKGKVAGTIAGEFAELAATSVTIVGDALEVLKGIRDSLGGPRR